MNYRIISKSSSIKNMEKSSPKITQFNFNFILEVKKSNDVKNPIKEEDEKEIKITSDEQITKIQIISKFHQ